MNGCECLSNVTNLAWTLSWTFYKFLALFFLVWISLITAAIFCFSVNHLSEKRKCFFYLSKNDQHEKKWFNDNNEYTCLSNREFSNFFLFRIFLMWYKLRILNQRILVCFFRGFHQLHIDDLTTASCWYDREKRACLFGARLTSYRVKQRLLHVATLQPNNQVVEQNRTAQQKKKQNSTTSTPTNYAILLCVAVWLYACVREFAVCTIFDCLFYFDGNMKIYLFPFHVEIICI